MPARLPRTYFDRSHLEVARGLIGCELVWDDVGGIIVETEGYGAEGDPACHTFSRTSARTFFESNPPATVYAYISYGVHWMLNVVTADGIVLIRALEPTRGAEIAKRRRGVTRLAAVCSGPGKLGQAIRLGASDHGSSLVSARRHVLPRGRTFRDDDVACDLRVGISQAVDRPWRFLLTNNIHVSVRLGRTASRRPRPRSRQSRTRSD